jgi:hypothetical protein
MPYTAVLSTNKDHVDFWMDNPRLKIYPEWAHERNWNGSKFELNEDYNADDNSSTASEGVDPATAPWHPWQTPLPGSTLESQMNSIPDSAPEAELSNNLRERVDVFTRFNPVARELSPAPLDPMEEPPPRRPAWEESQPSARQQDNTTLFHATELGGQNTQPPSVGNPGNPSSIEGLWAQPPNEEVIADEDGNEGLGRDETFLLPRYCYEIDHGPENEDFDERSPVQSTDDEYAEIRPDNEPEPELHTQLVMTSPDRPTGMAQEEWDAEVQYWTHRLGPVRAQQVVRELFLDEPPPDEDDTE